jgi:hypothetical protein
MQEHDALTFDNAGVETRPDYDNGCDPCPDAGGARDFPVKSARLAAQCPGELRQLVAVARVIDAFDANGVAVDCDCAAQPLRVEEEYAARSHDDVISVPTPSVNVVGQVPALLAEWPEHAGRGSLSFCPVAVVLNVSWDLIARPEVAASKCTGKEPRHEVHGRGSDQLVADGDRAWD